MASYVSRHNPRRQTLLLGERVVSVERYDRFYDIAWEAVHHGFLPIATVPAGRLVFRYLKLDIEKARTIAPAAKSSESIANRYSGARLTGAGGQGALYLASLGALLREHVHYSGGPKPGFWTPGAPDNLRIAMKTASTAIPATGTNRFFHVYRLKDSLRLADLRLVSLTGLLERMLLQGARERFGLVTGIRADALAQLVLDRDDYSAARGMADAIADLLVSRNLGGIIATSARGDSDAGVILDAYGDGVEGYVYVLFGKPDERLNVLSPVDSYASFNQLKESVKSLPGFAWVA